VMPRRSQSEPAQKMEPIYLPAALVEVPPVGA